MSHLISQPSWLGVILVTLNDTACTAQYRLPGDVVERCARPVGQRDPWQAAGWLHRALAR